jgi:retron-type reverse transcriptase
MFGGNAPQQAARPVSGSFTKPPPLPASGPLTGNTAKKQPPAPKKLNFDLGRFAPLTANEVRKEARAMGRGTMFSNPWFGRRDRIPPSSDPRTELINRGMVGAGLITPEQLAEIHEIGKQMDELRPELAQAGTAANEAVLLDAEERKRRKAQKQAEAVEKKRQHEAAVRDRKQNDIVFLGRGVSGGLADRRVNVEKLQQFQLPVMATPSDVAKALGQTIGRLRWLAFHSEASTITHYIRFQIPKKSGGMRELSSPHRDLGRAQHWILANILERIPSHDAAHGFVLGRGTMSNAVPHVARDTVINLDLKDFFPSITFPRVKGIFQSMGYSPAVATILALLCTECPRRKMEYAGHTLHVATGPRALPQGACTSPALSNLLARRLDKRLVGLAAKLNFTYTRYADDLTFSATKEAATKTGYLITRVRHIIREEHLTVNETKTRVQSQGMRQTVTGIVVNKRPNVPRRTVKRLRAILHQAGRSGLAAQNREKRDNFAPWLEGMIGYVNMVNPHKGRKLQEALQKIGS